MGRTLVGSHESNIYGHFEDESVMRMQETVLYSHGYSWWNPPTHNTIASWPPDTFRGMRNLIMHRNENHVVWGWKEPRTIFFLDQYIDLLVNPRFLFIFRDAMSCACSINKRDKHSVEDALRMHKTQLEYLKDGMELILRKGFPICSWRYENMIKDGRRAAEEVVKFIGMGDVNYLAALVDPKEKHF
jgi:hypothetical protein